MGQVARSHYTINKTGQLRPNSRYGAGVPNGVITSGVIAGSVVIAVSSNVNRYLHFDYSKKGARSASQAKFKFLSIYASCAFDISSNCLLRRATLLLSLLMSERVGIFTECNKLSKRLLAFFSNFLVRFCKAFWRVLTSVETVSRVDCSTSSPFPTNFPEISPRLLN